MKINKFSNDLPKEIVAKIKDSVAIDTEATGLKIPERDKLSLIQLCDASEVLLGQISDKITSYKSTTT